MNKTISLYRWTYMTRASRQIRSNNFLQEDKEEPPDIALKLKGDNKDVAELLELLDGPMWLEFRSESWPWQMLEVLWELVVQMLFQASMGAGLRVISSSHAGITTLLLMVVDSSPEGVLLVTTLSLDGWCVPPPCCALSSLNVFTLPPKLCHVPDCLYQLYYISGRHFQLLDCCGVVKLCFLLLMLSLMLSIMSSVIGAFGLRRSRVLNDGGGQRCLYKWGWSTFCNEHQNLAYPAESLW